MKNTLSSKLRIRYICLLLIEVSFALLVSRPLSMMFFGNSGFQFYISIYLISYILFRIVLQITEMSSSLNRISFKNIFPIYEKKIISKNFNLSVLESALKKSSYKSRTVENKVCISTTVNSTRFTSGEQIEIIIVPIRDEFEISIISYSRNFFTLFDKGLNILH